MIRLKALAPDYKIITNTRNNRAEAGSFIPENFTISSIPQSPENHQQDERPQGCIKAGGMLALQTSSSVSSAVWLSPMALQS
jgi:hypothetical protein